MYRVGRKQKDVPGEGGGIRDVPPEGRGGGGYFNPVGKQARLTDLGHRIAIYTAPTRPGGLTASLKDKKG